MSTPVIHESQGPERAAPCNLKNTLAEFGLVIGFLSRIPVPNLKEFAGDGALARALRFAPIAGLAVSSVPALIIAMGVQLVLPGFATATLAVAGAILITGALHEDGLADVADGFGGGMTRERKLAIMRDSRIGTYGAAALVCSIVLRIACIARLTEQGTFAVVVSAIVVAACVSRALMLLPMAFLRSARQDGLARRAGVVTMSSFAFAIGLALLLTGVPFIYGAYTLSRWATAVGMATLGCVATTVLAQRQIGGVTGDVVGASQQVAEIAVLLVLSAGALPT